MTRSELLNSESYIHLVREQYTYDRVDPMTTVMLGVPEEMPDCVSVIM